ncbi:hypothetical protein SAMN02745176_02561 [Lutispora thermophila DSM 19022]|uniref:Uncharacterized protein n=1 Tax=Lutispora thermophila DSM 19022 TaxID=1122184 RepID=A0A1M6GX49_9FIRM|nr:hypothetical protein SAMN02745176_02561 [Lutispora thermophila DSM 19022]
MEGITIKKLIFKLYIGFPLALLTVILLFWHKSLNLNNLIISFLIYYSFTTIVILALNIFKFENMLRNNPYINKYTNFTFQLIAIIAGIIIYNQNNNIYNYFFWGFIGIMLPLSEFILSHMDIKSNNV